MPTKSGQPASSSLHLVGSFVDSCNMVWQPLSAANTCLIRLSHTTISSVAKMQLHGYKSPTPAGIAVKSPTPAGIAVKACRNLAPCCFKLFAWYSSASPNCSLYPSVQCCKQFLTFGFFQPQCFGDSIKVESEDCFQCSILSLCFAHFFL